MANFRGRVNLPAAAAKSSPSPRGAWFEDCWRLAAMSGDLDPRDRLTHILFDFKDLRYSSTELREFYRDRILGLWPVP